MRERERSERAEPPWKCIITKEQRAYPSATTESTLVPRCRGNHKKEKMGKKKKLD
jgi:hypothetical protein